MLARNHLLQEAASLCSDTAWEEKNSLPYAYACFIELILMVHRTTSNVQQRSIFTNTDSPPPAVLPFFPSAICQAESAFTSRLSFAWQDFAHLLFLFPF